MMAQPLNWIEYRAQAERYIIFHECAQKRGKEWKRLDPEDEMHAEIFQNISLAVHAGFAAEM